MQWHQTTFTFGFSFGLKLKPIKLLHTKYYPSFLLEGPFINVYIYFQTLSLGFHTSVVSKSELKTVRKSNLTNIVGRNVTLSLNSFSAKEVLDHTGTVRVLLTLNVTSPEIRLIRAEINLKPYSSDFDLHATFGFIHCYGRKAMKNNKH